MEICRIRALLGPNVWADFPVAEVWFDLSALTTEEVNEFGQTLRPWLIRQFPDLRLPRRPAQSASPPAATALAQASGAHQDQRCLRHEQWLARVLLRIILDLHARLGERPAYGRLRRTAQPGLYQIAFQILDGPPPGAFVEVALDLLRSARTSTPFDLETRLHALDALARESRPTATVSALLDAARARDIPTRRLGKDLVLLGQGAKQRRLLGGATSGADLAASQIVADRDLLRSLLACVGLNCTAQPATDMHYRILTAGRRVLATLLWQPGNSEEDPGGPVEDVSGLVHPEVCARALDATRALGIGTAEVRVLAADITQPLEVQGSMIAEVIPAPPLDPYLRAVGRRPIADALVEAVYGPGENGRIPIAAVSGTNGKTTVTRLIAHGLGLTGRFVGMTCTDGIYLSDRRIDTDDCSGPQSARMVLLNPEVEAAVLETARGGILREGLGFDACDVAVVTNIGEGDHLGLGGIETPRELAAVKQTVVRAVAPWGTAVLNAADPLVVPMARQCRGSVLFFARDGSHPVLLRHRRQGGRVAFVRGQELFLAKGEAEKALLPLQRIPLTRGGRIGFQVENVLAAAGSLWALGVPLETLGRALSSFGADLDKSPGRFNVLSLNGATAVFDYGHNPSALLAMVDALDAFTHRQRIAVYSAAGDRRDVDLIRQGEILGQAFDRVILYEDQYTRGRLPGEIMSLFRQGLAAGTRVQEVQAIHGWQDAVEAALWTAQPGDLLLVQADVIDVTVDYVRARLAEDQARQQLPLSRGRAAWSSTDRVQSATQN